MSRNAGTRRLTALAVVAAVAGLVGQDAWAGPKSKAARQVRAFEHIVDRMLVDSPNWLVRDSNETRGTYVEGHGAVFTFDASLVGSGFGHRGHDGIWGWWRGDHDRRVIVIDDEWDDEDEDSDRDGRRKSRDRWFEREMKRQERRYVRAKAEVVDLIVDFGDILSSLDDGEWLEIEAFLEGADYFYEKDIEQLSLRVKMADVRAFSAGSLDEKGLVERIQTKES